jgi:hypothetical protein
MTTRLGNVIYWLVLLGIVLAYPGLLGLGGVVTLVSVYRLLRHWTELKSLGRFGMVVGAVPGSGIAMMSLSDKDTGDGGLHVGILGPSVEILAVCLLLAGAIGAVRKGCRLRLLTTGPPRTCKARSWLSESADRTHGDYSSAHG